MSRRARYPELELFETPEQQTAALAAANRSISRNIRYWVFVIGAQVVGQLFGRWALHSAVWLLEIPRVPRFVDHITGGTVASLATTFSYLLFSKQVARHLRQQLHTAGHAICLECGYDLRGSPGPLCPECGTTQPPREKADPINKDA